MRVAEGHTQLGTRPSSSARWSPSTSPSTRTASRCCPCSCPISLSRSSRASSSATHPRASSSWPVAVRTTLAEAMARAEFVAHQACLCCRLPRRGGALSAHHLRRPDCPAQLGRARGHLQRRLPRAHAPASGHRVCALGADDRLAQGALPRRTRPPRAPPELTACVRHSIVHGLLSMPL